MVTAEEREAIKTQSRYFGTIFYGVVGKGY